MTDKRSHRGSHPSDAKLFCADALGTLHAAVADFSMLLTKGYADKSALKLVGDRFSLTQRQRIAVMRSSCSDRHLAARNESRVPLAEMHANPIAIDGYNLLITIEAALSGGLLFKGRDCCLRDLASIHGTYRKVTETIPAIELVGRFLADQNVTDALWLLDSPVSNSGRLKTILRQTAETHGWPWSIELVISPDKILRETDRIVVTTDSAILDACRHWVNLAAKIIYHSIPSARIIDLAAQSNA